MKRLYILFLCTLATAGCETIKKIEMPLLDPMLTLNASIDAGKSENIIFLSISDTYQTTAVSGNATVSYSIDSSEQKTARGTGDDYNWRYIMDGDLTSGSKINISASFRNMAVSGSCIVPSQPSLGNIKVLDMGKEIGYQLLSLPINDIKGEDNYYRLDPTISLKGARVIAGENTKNFKKGDLICSLGPHTSIQWDLSPALEPVLGGGLNFTTDGDFTLDLGSLMEINNYYIFTDREFKDKEYTLRLLFDASAVPSYLININDGATANELDGKDIIMEIDSSVKVYSISKMGYNKYRAVDYTQNFGTDLNFIFEPAVIPNNVSGGLGSVLAEMPAEMDFTFSLKGKFSSVAYY